MIHYGILSVIFAVVLWYLIINIGGPSMYVSPDDARRGLAEGKFRSVVDVRSAAEYQGGHYRDAISFPVNLINDQTVGRKMVSERMFNPVLVYCNSGRRAKVAADSLSRYGVPDVYYTDVPYWKLTGVRV